MKKTILTLLTCLSFNSLPAEIDFIEARSRLYDYIDEYKGFSQDICEVIEILTPGKKEYDIAWQYHQGKIDAYNEIRFWLEFNGGPCTSD